MSRLFDGIYFYVCPPVSHVAGVRKFESASLLGAADLAGDVAANGGGLLTSLSAAEQLPRAADGSMAVVFALGNPSQCYHASEELRKASSPTGLTKRSGSSSGFGFAAAARSSSSCASLVNGSGAVVFVRPAFVKDCLAANALLPHTSYLVFNPSPSLDGGVHSPASSATSPHRGTNLPSSSFEAALKRPVTSPGGAASDEDAARIETAIAAEMHELASLIDGASVSPDRAARLEAKLDAIIASGVAALEARRAIEM